MQHLFFQTFILISLIAVTASQAVAQGSGKSFELKGRSLGQSPELACQGSPLTDHQELVISAGIPGMDYPAASCEVQVLSVADVVVQKPAHLLFWKGQLTRIVIRFGVIDLEPLAQLRGTLVQGFGKSVVRTSKPFRSEVWSRGLEQLQLERTEGMPSDVDLFLTHTSRMSEYKKSRARVEAAIAGLSEFSCSRR